MTTDKPPWQPKRVIRFIRALPTATDTVEVSTDQGDGFLKALGNRAGPHPLACELVATKLARWFGLPTFDFALVEITESNYIPFARGGQALPGPAFITRKEEGLTWGGSEQELTKLENPQDISRLVVFDTWTRNCDRYPPDLSTRKPNRDNVFLSSEETRPNRLMLKAMDHTHCFTCGRDLTGDVANIDRVKDTRPYGLFPEFLPYLGHDAVMAAINDLRSLPRAEVEAIIRDVPNEWQVSQPARAALVELIVQRATFIADNPKIIIDEIIMDRLGR